MILQYMKPCFKTCFYINNYYKLNEDIVCTSSDYVGIVSLN